MRGFTSLVLLCLSVLPFSFAAARSRSHNSENAISRRQHHVPRALVDICASLDLGILANNVAGLDVGDVFGHVCLCLSAFPLNLEAYVGLKAILDLLGADEVEALLKVLIGNSGHQCTYPQHSKPKCSDKCDFDCDDGYVKQGDQCVCKAPNTECNGKCGSYPHGCSSAVPRTLGKARLASDTKPFTLRDAQSACGHEHVCGVYSKRSGFECVDVKRNVESCGGCVLPHPFGGQSQHAPGVDCSIIPFALDVSCASGKCIVGKCDDGYHVGDTLDICVPDSDRDGANGAIANIVIDLEAQLFGNDSLVSSIVGTVESLLSSVLSLNLTLDVETHSHPDSGKGQDLALTVDLKGLGDDVADLAQGLGSDVDGLVQSLGGTLSSLLNIDVVANVTIGETNGSSFTHKK